MEEIPFRPKVSYGTWQLNTHKAEDVWHVEPVEKAPDGTTPLPAGFAVFDGHGGKAAAQACREGIIGRLIKDGQPRDASAIASAFWETDESLGQSGILSGTTASDMASLNAMAKKPP